MQDLVLISNGYLAVPAPMQDNAPDMAAVGTLVSNIIYYGFVPSTAAVEALALLSNEELVSFWNNTEVALREVTGANRNMAKYVVYKNFPKEVLDMSKGEYWIKQIFMYWGAPSKWFTQKEEERSELSDKKNLKVLALASANVAEVIWGNLLKNTSRWSDTQTQHAKILFDLLNVKTLDVADFGFRENAITLISYVNEFCDNITINDATDVLRLAALMSEGDVSLRVNTKFKKFNRPMRKRLLGWLEGSKNLLDDMALRPEPWKKLMYQLHPNDYSAYTAVSDAYNKLLNGEAETFNAKVEALLLAKDVSVLDLLVGRAGNFSRRLHALYGLFGRVAFEKFAQCLDQLSNSQLIKIDKYLATINDRQGLMHAPKGAWRKVKLVPNQKTKIAQDDLAYIRKAISAAIRWNLSTIVPTGVAVDPKAFDIKLQTNDQKLASYGRGTSFDIPSEMTFARSASFWKHDGQVWWDNGWSFYGEGWTPMFACDWHNTHDADKGALYSGDPMNSKNLDGGACQMIDLYFDKLEAAGVRYALWSILAYSNITFADAREVLATLQLGEQAETGNLYEPSRAQMVFPLTSNTKTSYVAYIDIPNRKLVYMDVDFGGGVSHVGGNLPMLASKMPSYVEYLNSLPSVGDLMSNAPAGDFKVLYTDKNTSITEGSAYVFKKENAGNTFDSKDIVEFL